MSKSLDDILKKMQDDLQKKKEVEYQKNEEINRIREIQRKDWIKRSQIYERMIFENLNLKSSKYSGSKVNNLFSGIGYDWSSSDIYLISNGVGSILPDIIDVSSVISNNPDDPDFIYFYESTTGIFGKFDKKSFIRTDISNFSISILPTNLFYGNGQFILLENFTFSPSDTNVFSISENGVFTNLGTIPLINGPSGQEGIFGLLFFKNNWYFTTFGSSSPNLYLMDFNTLSYSPIGTFTFDESSLPPQFVNISLAYIFSFAVNRGKVWASILFYDLDDGNSQNYCIGEVDIDNRNIKYLFRLGGPDPPIPSLLFSSISYV